MSPKKIARLIVCALLTNVSFACSHGRGGQTPAVTGVDAASSVGAPATPANPTTGALDGGRTTTNGGPATLGPKHRWPSCDAGSVSDQADWDAGPTPYQDCTIDETHGVFVDVARGDDTRGDGSRDAPLKSLAAAVRQALAQKKHVFACNGVYEEALLIDGDSASGLKIYGGLSCDTFLPDPAGAHAVVRSKGQGAALEIADTRMVTIERFDFENLAADGDAPGTTYIGGFIQDAHNIALRGVTLRTDSGKDGADAKPADGVVVSGTAGNAGADACSANPNPGGAVVSTNGCFAQSMTTAGGSGGDGAIGTGNGGNGTWLSFSQGGLGEVSSDWSCAQGMGGGPTTNVGGPGAPGNGAKGFGALIGSGFVGFNGQAGMPGTPGYGGSGGGGAKAPATCAGMSMASGASGGGGGSGGCPGAGGKGGAPGGSSFGIVLIDSEVLIENSVVAYGNGGHGGKGAAGQAGGDGAPGGKGGRGSAGSKAGCDGTPGGKGGDGGPGGGGNGGHAIGVLFLGKHPKLIDVRGENTPGKGGAPGSGPAGVADMIAPQLVGSEGVSALSYAM